MVGIFCLLGATTAMGQIQTPQVRRIGASEETFTSAGVVVAKSTALARTTQLLPKDTTSLQTQVLSLQEQLAELRADYPSNELVQLNLYVSGIDALVELQRTLMPSFASQPPALTVVETDLPGEAAMALDALFTISGTDDVQWLPKLTLQPAGNTVYISGQAEKADDLRTATRKTYEGLMRTLEFLKLRPQAVISIKAFCAPMTDAETVVQVTREFFPDNTPALSLVEWRSSLPIEIEMVVSNAGAEVKEPVEYLTPPWMTKSPVYSRIARVGNVPVLYVSGFYSSGSPEEQVRGLFRLLTEVCQQAGTDLRHLAKATYYVSADDVSRAHNELRPEYYDPERPPAASKAMVAGIARTGSTITMDMIAAIPEKGK